jgi:hypothetical protein
MFFTITSDNITTLNGYIAGMVGDLMPIILIVLGVAIAMFIFNRLTK